MNHEGQHDGEGSNNMEEMRKYSFKESVLDVHKETTMDVEREEGDASNDDKKKRKKTNRGFRWG